MKRNDVLIFIINHGSLFKFFRHFRWFNSLLVKRAKEIIWGGIVMTNQEKFIQTFGIDAWQQMIAFSGLAEQFKEYWTSPYKAKSKVKE